LAAKLGRRGLESLRFGLNFSDASWKRKNKAVRVRSNSRFRSRLCPPIAQEGAVPLLSRSLRPLYMSSSFHVARWSVFACWKNGFKAWARGMPCALAKFSGLVGQGVARGKARISKTTNPIQGPRLHRNWTRSRRPGIRASTKRRGILSGHLLANCIKAKVLTMSPQNHSLESVSAESEIRIRSLSGKKGPERSRADIPVGWRQK